MKSKIEVNKTYWFGVTETQLVHLRVMLDYLQASDLEKASSRVSVSSIDLEAHKETLQDLKTAVQHNG